MRFDPSDLQQLAECLRPIIGDELRLALAEVAGELIPKPKPWLTRKELAERLGIGEHVVRDADQRGELPSVRVGKQARYNVIEVEAALRNGKAP
jgi:excisionase family DNA binding protein